MIDLKQYEIWFLTGSQHLYGEETLNKVAEHSGSIVKGLSEVPEIPVNIISKPVLTNPSTITDICTEANSSKKCIGVITWMHTFSPAKMWIAGLKILKKPLAHLHTQFNRDIPWSQIDMDFMNLNQSAHGGREFGFICTRMGIKRKVIVGHWQDKDVHKQLGIWTRAAAAWADSQSGKIARFGDNMREVAVTEGDKVEAQIKFGYSVNGFGIGDLVKFVNNVDENRIDELIEIYRGNYTFDEKDILSIREAARIELGMKYFLEEGKYTGFTTTFEDLHGLKQLPGIAVQRLMQEGYGFGAEGDWKTAALVRAMKVMAAGLPGGTSFMEDYTYHLDPNGMKVLGAHMLEICPSISSGKPSLETHQLGIGGKADPARLVFNVEKGDALNASIIDLGNRFRMIVNTCKVVEPEEQLPNLPVARVLWEPNPELKTAAACWILAGGAHHTGFTKALSKEYLEDFCEIAGIEYLLIDEETKLIEFKNELRWNSAAYS